MVLLTSGFRFVRSKYMKNIVFILTLSFCFQSFAKGGFIDVSGGGFGIQIGNQIVLQDLVEAGFENHTISPSVDKNYKDSLQAISWMNPEAKAILLDRITLISKYDLILPAAIIKAIGFYSWSFTHQELRSLPLQDAQLKVNYLQLAIRQGLQISIFKKAWDLMLPAHQAALVLHEVMSSLKSGDTPETRNRQLIGGLFLASLQNPIPLALLQEMQRSWPSRESIFKKLTRFDDVTGADSESLVVRNGIKWLPSIQRWDVFIFPSVEMISVQNRLFKKHPERATFTYINRFSVQTFTTYLCLAPKPKLKQVAYNAMFLNLKLSPLSPNNAPRLETSLKTKTLFNFNLEYDRNRCTQKTESTAELLYLMFKDPLS